MAEKPIELDLDRDTVYEFSERMRDLFYNTRPDYEECVFRCKVLKLINRIWQQFLIEKEQNAMINKSSAKYAKLITDDSAIDIEDIPDERTGRPYQKYVDSHGHADSTQRNAWCTPIEATRKVIVIREYEDGPVVKRVEIPSVMIFGSIAFGLDGIGSDIDLALPAGVHKVAVSAHHDGALQVRLLKEFQHRLSLNASLCRKAGFVWKVEPVLHARVPIIKLTARVKLKNAKGKVREPLQVDVGVRSTQMPITKMISFFCNYDERVAVFFMFVKQWSKRRMVSDAMHGFPNSFGFVMLATKFLQLLEEPILPIVDWEKDKRRLYAKYAITKFRRNEMSLLEIAVSFFDYWFDFDFAAYQIAITEPGLQWKHASDYNLSHADQSTMLIEDPSADNENVTRCLKPYNLKVLRHEMLRGFKCAQHGDWRRLMRPFEETPGREFDIFKLYPCENERERRVWRELNELDGGGGSSSENWAPKKNKKKKKKKALFKKAKASVAKMNQAKKAKAKYKRKEKKFYAAAGAENY